MEGGEIKKYVSLKKSSIYLIKHNATLTVYNAFKYIIITNIIEPVIFMFVLYTAIINTKKSKKLIGYLKK